MCISILLNQITAFYFVFDKTHAEIWTSNGYSFIPTQNQESESLVQIVNACFYVSVYESYLEVDYTYPNYAGPIDAAGPGADHVYIKLLFSLDNMSFIEVKRNEMDVDQGLKNGSGVFKVSHSFIDPFPFNVEKNSTLFIKLDRGFHRGAWGDWSIYRTASVELLVPIDIKHPWIYSINPILLFPLLITIGALGSIFLVTRRKRIQKSKIPMKC